MTEPTPAQQKPGLAQGIEAARRTASLNHPLSDRLNNSFNDNLPQALAYIDCHEICRFANRAFCALLDLPKQHIVDQPAHAFLNTQTCSYVREPYAQALAGQINYSEYPLHLESGGVRWITIAWLPDFNDQGGIRGVYAMIQDISVRDMQFVMDNIAVPITFIDTEERIRFVNHPGLLWLNKPASEIIGKTAGEVFSPLDYQFAKPYIAQALSGKAVQYERQFEDHQGQQHWLLVRHVPTYDRQNQLTGFYTTATDIQEIKEQEIALEQTNWLLNAHFENTPLASIALDVDLKITRWSSQAKTLFAWSHGEALGKTVWELGLIKPEFANDLFLNHKQSAAHSPSDTEASENTPPTIHVHLCETQRRNGSSLICEWHIAMLHDIQGHMISALVLIQDVTPRIETERRLKHAAQSDALTKLLNRHALEPTLHEFIRRATQDKTGVAVLFVDLDHFKNINDTLGHRVGDLLLIEIAQTLSRCIRPDDAIVRIGGDEFMVIIEHRQPKAIAHEIAQRILHSLSEPILVQAEFLSVSASIGIAIYPDHGNTPEKLLRSADLAMYKAKEHGKNCFEFFSASLAQYTERRNALKNALSNAIEQGLLRLHYQPRIDVFNGRIVGSEALLRWTDPIIGVVNPKEFINLAEESGLIHQLGLQVFRKAALQVRNWQERKIPFGVLSVNFSAQQLLVPTFVDELDRVLEETGCDPRRIEVEITETSLLFDLGITKSVIADLKHRGMRISIDDFGTGFSSLSHLQQLDIDALKIDQSFIRDMLEDPSDFAITRSVISLGRGLGLCVTAEGVENEYQLAALKDAGCHHYQGFYFSPAIPCEDFEILLIEFQAL